MTQAAGQFIKYLQDVEYYVELNDCFAANVVVHAAHLHAAKRGRRSDQERAFDKIIHVRVCKLHRVSRARAKEGCERSDAAQRQQSKMKEKKVDAQCVPEAQKGLEGEGHAEEIQHVLGWRSVPPRQERMAPRDLAQEMSEKAGNRRAVGWPLPRRANGC